MNCKTKKRKDKIKRKEEWIGERQERRQERLAKIALQMIDDNGRQCGDCNACCTVMAVQDLNKGYYERCQHVGNEGCTIYPDRPRSCKVWYCYWRCGLVDGAKPNEIGLLVNAAVEDALDIYEVWEGAALSQDAWEYMAALYKSTKSHLRLWRFSATPLPPAVSRTVIFVNRLRDIDHLRAEYEKCNNYHERRKNEAT